MTAARVTSGVEAAFAVSSSAVRMALGAPPCITWDCVIFCIGVMTDSLAGIRVPVLMAWAAAARARAFSSGAAPCALRKLARATAVTRTALP